jgi:hypothetical protein
MVSIQELTVLSARAVTRSYKEDSWGNQVSSLRESVKKRVSWKEAAPQKVLQAGNKGIAIVKNRYQGTAGEDTEGWKRFRCAVMICKIWRSAMAL